MEIGILSIIVGFIQAVALIITLCIVAYVAFRQLRAYVDIESARLARNPHDANGPWSILIQVKNFGQTPAQIVAAKFEKQLGPRRNETVIFPFTQNAEDHPSPGVRIAPGHFHTVAIQCQEIGVGQAGWTARSLAHHKTYVWGRLEYVDAFSFRRFIRFQMYYDFDEMEQFALCESGNSEGVIGWKWRW